MPELNVLCPIGDFSTQSDQPLTKHLVVEGDSVRLETIIGTWNHPPMPSVVKMAPCRFRGCEKFMANSLGHSR